MKNACAVAPANESPRVEDDTIFYDQAQAQAVAVRLTNDLLREWEAIPVDEAPLLANRLLSLVKMVGDFNLEFGDIEAVTQEIQAAAIDANISDDLSQDVCVFANCLFAQWCWNRGIAPIG